MKSAVTGIIFVIGILFLQTELLAQDYRVYTKIFHEQGSSPEETPKVIARSLTICHAGKVYDRVGSIGELVVYDPHQQRFTIISSPHRMACTVDFSELRQFLKVAKTEARKYLEDLSESSQSDSSNTVELISFQLNPRFKKEYNPTDHVLSFTSPQMSYIVETIDAPSPEIAEAFRQYADWTVQLNFVLHGKSSMPAPRLQLNQHLLERQLLPIKVTLTLADSANTKLTAEHTIDWELSKDDRFLITKWKHELQDGQLKFVSFHEYQKKLLAQYSNK